MKPTTRRATVENAAPLLDFLFEWLPGESKTTVKSYLRNRQVSIDGCMTTRFDAPLVAGSVVELSTERTKASLRHPKLRIVWEDDELVLVEKREGLLSIATDKQLSRTAYNIVSDYIKADDPTARIFVVHRLDRETSGLMLFAKNDKIKFALQSDWNNIVLERTYVAVAEGLFDKDQDMISTYLTENKALKVFACERGQGKIAQTHYKVLARNEKRGLTMVELQLETGRKNQIRAHLEYIDRPIVGDKKYGSRGVADVGRVCLHARSIRFVHPTTGEEHAFTTPIPGAFMSLFK